jgi:hypothetical protein
MLGIVVFGGAAHVMDQGANVEQKQQFFMLIKAHACKHISIYMLMIHAHA